MESRGKKQNVRPAQMISGMIGLVGLFLHPEVMQKMCAQ
jgi:hypothetical protein